MAEFTGIPRGAGRRIVVVVSRFNESITRRLADGALDALLRHGASLDDIDVVWVPGAWEIPIAARAAHVSGDYEGIVALGAVIRGDTPHFEYVAGEATRGLGALAAEYEVPIGFGLLTCDNMEQAEARAGGEHGNKGWDAALALLETLDVIDQFQPAADAD